jgi:peptide deformylase
MLEIVHYPHPALRWKSQPVGRIDKQLRKTVEEMLELMYEFKGIGLAANQVALPLRLFVMNPTGDPEERDQELVFINPEITRRKGSVEGEEGCLSLPEVYGEVRRAAEIVVDAFDLTGQGFQCALDDLPGRVVQHEYDHLDGVMFFDRMTDEGRQEIETKIAEFEHTFRQSQSKGETPSDDELKRQLEALQH